MAGGKDASEYSSLYTESLKATTDDTTEMENFDVLMCYNCISNLKRPAGEAKEILRNAGFSVKDSVDVSMDAGKLKVQLIEQHFKRSKYRVCLFNKAFHKHEMDFYGPMLLNSRFSTAENTLILSRHVHKKKIPQTMGHLKHEPLSARVNGEEIATKIRLFVEAHKNAHILGELGEVETPAGPSPSKISVKKDMEYAQRKKHFLEMVDGFTKRRTYILCVSVKPVQPCVCNLALLSWLKVFDFHRSNEVNHLLNEVKTSLQSGNFVVSKSEEKPTKPSDKITDWTSVSVLDDDGGEENGDAEMSDYLSEHISSLTQYCSGQKVATMIILWHYDPAEDELEDKLRDFLANVKYAFKPPREVKFVLCIPNVPESGTNLAKISKKFVQTNRVIAPLETFCEWIAEIASEPNRINHVSAESTLPKLPDEEGGESTFKVEQADLNWLMVDMQVLLLDGHDDATAVEELSARGVDFLNGGDIGWDVIKSGKYDVRRDITQPIIDYLVYRHINIGACGIVTLFHAPGSGGTTVGKRVLWELRRRVPCMMLDPKAEVQEDFKEKIKYVRDKSNLPILLLVDGRSSQEVRNLLDVCRYERIIIFHVVRYYQSIRKQSKAEGKFFLEDCVSEFEAPKFEQTLVKHGNAGIKKRMATLTVEVKNGTKHSVFEYGLTAFHSNFRGVQKYVESHLLMNEGEQAWHKVAAYLSLANYYGNRGLPAEFFSRILETQHYSTVELDSIPEFGQQLIRECSDFCDWKVPHYMIAKEILEQYLTRKRSDKIHDGLSAFACTRLDELACEFLDVAREHVVNADSIPAHILTILNSIFIFRHHKEANEHDDYQAKSTYSRLICDVGLQEKQHKVFNKLVENFSSHAEFHAHLGRFLGKTNHHEEAVSALKKAVEIRNGELKYLGKRKTTADESLHRIHSMFGYAFNAHVRHVLGNHKVGYILKRECETVSKSDAEDILISAIHAIDQFRKTRENYCPSASPSYGYIGEIQIRLHVTEFCKKRTEYNLDALEDKQHPLHFLWDFVCKSFIECEYLLDQCIIATGDTDIVQRDIEKYFNLYHEYFVRSVDKFDRWAKDGPTMSSKRCKIALLKVKLNSRRKREFRVFDDLIHPQSVVEFVNLHEEILNDRANGTIKISSYMEDWLKAIRLPRVERRYKLEEVIQYVERWDKKGERGSISTYYNYVLHFLHAVFSQTPASVKITQNIQRKLEESHQSLPRRILEKPREWIKMVHDFTPFMTVLHHYQQRDQPLHVFTGCITVAKTWYGQIDIDSAMSSKLEAYFVPQKFGIKSYHGRERARVEFHIGFNPKRGAQAYKVKLITTVTCPACLLSTEALSLCTAHCQRCHRLLPPAGQPQLR